MQAQKWAIISTKNDNFKKPSRASTVSVSSINSSTLQSIFFSFTILNNLINLMNLNKQKILNKPVEASISFNYFESR